MRKTILALSFVLIGFLLASGFQTQTPAPAKKIDVSGIWEMIIDTPQGSMPPSDTTFEQQGEALKITMKGLQGEDLKCEGKIKADAIEWTLSISSPRGDMTIIFKGKVEGETMSGQADLGDFGSMVWKASKKK